MGVEQTSRLPQDANSVKRIIGIAEAVRPKTKVYGCVCVHVCVCVHRAFFFLFFLFRFPEPLWS